MEQTGTLTPQTMPITEKTPTKRGGAYKEPTERHVAAAALIDAGMDPKIAARQLGYSEHYVPRLVQRIKEKGITEYVTEKRLKSAKHVVDTFMKGQPVGRKIGKDEVGNAVVLEPGIMPKDSTIKDCAMSVLDRAYPKAQEGTQQSISFTQINLGVLTPTPICSEKDITNDNVIEVDVLCSKTDELNT
jgi:hypothetical protein